MDRVESRIDIDIDIDEFPIELRKYLADVKIYDSSCSSEASTMYLEGSKELFLKSSKLNSMKREYENTNFLNLKAVAPKVLEYINYNGKDYLLTERIPGEDGISGNHMDNPKKLAEVFGESLRMLHSISTEECPNKNRTLEIIEEARLNVENGGGDLEQLKSSFNLSIEEALNEMEKLVGCEIDDVILHGDYCLPNIIMDNFKFTGFIDLGYGGVGDKHWDIYWGIWTLRFNLGTDEYKDIFLKAYGLDEINEDRLKLCGLLAGLTG